MGLLPRPRFVHRPRSSAALCDEQRRAARRERDASRLTADSEPSSPSPASDRRGGRQRVRLRAARLFRLGNGRASARRPAAASEARVPSLPLLRRRAAARRHTHVARRGGRAAVRVTRGQRHMCIQTLERRAKKIKQQTLACFLRARVPTRADEPTYPRKNPVPRWSWSGTRYAP